MNSITFTIPGPPRGKGRPRFARRGNFTTTYTDDKTAAYENLVALAYKAAGGVMMSGAISLYITAYMPIPASWSSKKKALMEGAPHFKKPDCSNIQKAVEDGLNGVAYQDDSAIWWAEIKKQYDDGDGPRVVVEIESDERYA